MTSSPQPRSPSGQEDLPPLGSARLTAGLTNAIQADYLSALRRPTGKKVSLSPWATQPSKPSSWFVHSVLTQAIPPLETPSPEEVIK